MNAEGSLKDGAAIDFVARNEFDFTIKEVADGNDWSQIKGLSFRNNSGVIVHNEDRPILHDMDSLPFVTPVYKRDLVMEKLLHRLSEASYISIYTGRGCKSRCTFCLWPQTVGGHTYRTRSVGHVIEEIKWAMKAFPQTKEFFFDDDTFTDNLPRAEAIAKELGKLGVTWSCNAKANVPYESLKKLKDGGLRLLLVGYESGQPADPAQHQEGHAHRSRGAVHQGLPQARRRDPWHVHSGSARRIQRDDPRERSNSPSASTLTRSRCRWAAPYPGTFLYDQAVKKRLARCGECGAGGRQRHPDRAAALSHLSHGEIFNSLEGFYKEFYFRPSKIASIVGEMVRSTDMMKRRLREGVEFFQFLRERREHAA